MKIITRICTGIVGVTAICFGSGCTRSQAPSAQASANIEPIPKESKKLLSSYPEFDELRHPNLDKVVESLPEYRQAVADHDARINAKVGNISDSGLRLTLIKQAGIPEVNKYDFRELANKEIDRQRAAFLAEHKDCYFILGTYEFYLVDKQIAVFNLMKMGGDEHAEDFVRSNGFGKPLGDYTGRMHTSSLIGAVGAGINDTPGTISSRYSGDWLKSDDDLANYGLLVPITIEQLDKIYAAVRSKFSQQMDDIYASEMKVGGDNSYLDGHFERYCDQLPCDVLKKHIESYVRRQGIWVLAQGDPMNPEKIRVDKAWIVVGGPDIFLTLK